MDSTLSQDGLVWLTHGQALYVLMKKIVQVNMKRQNYQTSVKNEYNIYDCKNCFEWYHTHIGSQPKGK